MRLRPETSPQLLTPPVPVFPARPHGGCGGGWVSLSVRLTYLLLLDELETEEDSGAHTSRGLGFTCCAQMLTTGTDGVAVAVQWMHRSVDSKPAGAGRGGGGSSSALPFAGATQAVCTCSFCRFSFTVLRGVPNTTSCKGGQEGGGDTKDLPRTRTRQRQGSVSLPEYLPIPTLKNAKCGGANLSSLLSYLPH